MQARFSPWLDRTGRPPAPKLAVPVALFAPAVRIPVRRDPGRFRKSVTRASDRNPRQDRNLGGRSVVRPTQACSGRLAPKPDRDAIRQSGLWAIRIVAVSLAAAAPVLTALFEAAWSRVRNGIDALEVPVAHLQLDGPLCLVLPAGVAAVALRPSRPLWATRPRSAAPLRAAAE